MASLGQNWRWKFCSKWRTFQFKYSSAINRNKTTLENRIHANIKEKIINSRDYNKTVYHTEISLNCRFYYYTVEEQIFYNLIMLFVRNIFH